MGRLWLWSLPLPWELAVLEMIRPRRWFVGPSGGMSHTLEPTISEFSPQEMGPIPSALRPGVALSVLDLLFLALLSR